MAKKTYNQKSKERWQNREDKKHTEKKQQTEDFDRCMKVFGRITDVDINCAHGLIIVNKR